MDKVVKVVMKKIMNGRYDNSIFEQLLFLRFVCVPDINGSLKDCTSIRDDCPFIKKDYSEVELRKLRRLILASILEELKKPHTYLETARLVEAFNRLDDANKLPKSNKKIRFVISFNAVSQFYHGNMSPGLKNISLLDNI